MTSPAGPSNPTPPAGPGRAVPLTAERRMDNYRRQNGSERLTPRQRRRAEHKAARAALRAVERAA